MSAVAQAQTGSTAVAPAESWHALDKAFERVGRDSAFVYRCPSGLPCVVCRRPTRLMVSFSPRAALPICGTCRGY